MRPHLGELSLQLVESLERFRKTLERRIGPLEFFVRDSGRAEHDCACRHILCHARLRHDDTLVSNGQMTRDADLSRNGHAITDNGASGNTGERTNDAVLTNNAVMADLHKVVDLRASADAGPAKAATVNGRVRANLNIVANLGEANLGNLLMFAVDGLVTKTVCAQDDPAVQSHAVAEDRALAKADARVEQAVRTQSAPVTDVTASADDGAVPDNDLIFNHCVWLDGNVLAEFCRPGDHCSRMDAWFEHHRLWRHLTDKFGKSPRRIIDSDERAGKHDVQVFGNNQNRGARRGDCGLILRAGKKAEIAGSRFPHARKASHYLLGVARQLSPNHPRNIACRQLHTYFLSSFLSAGLGVSVVFG